MKKILNIFFISVILFLIINIFNLNTSLSTSLTTNDIEGIKIAKINPDNYEPGEITEGEVKTFTDKVGIALGAIRNVSAIVAVITLMIIGFRYIVGSAEDKANYKTTMVPYIIGCVMAVAGTTLVSFIYNSVH